MPASNLTNVVHIWFCRPDTIGDEAKLSAYRSVLSVQETAQYQRFHDEKDRHNYLVSHALLRHVLSKYADVAAAEWQFAGNAHGKPELLQQAGSPDIRFNLTHTDGLCACVVANMRCGVDAENIHRKNNLSAIAKRMFAEEELIAAGGNILSPAQFYDLWTLREAYVKALGTGLAGSSKDFYFSVDEARLPAGSSAGSSASINFRKKRKVDAGYWQFRLFEPTPEHRLAVAFDAAHPVSVHIEEFIP